MKLLVLDGNSILNRAFYGIKLLTTKDGRYTNGIVGFLNILLSLRELCQPDAVAIAFDVKAPTFRHGMYEHYKAQRKGMPPELAAQLPPLKELLTAMGLPLIEAPGWEADDILGTLAASGCGEDSCVLATGDRDSLQLVDGCVEVLLAGTKGGRPVTTRYTPEAVMEEYGVTPAQLIDVKALMGDASDNIPGVAGIGQKTAQALIARFDSLENLYERLDDPDIRPALRLKLEQGREDAFLSKALGTIRRDVPIPTAYQSYLPQAANAAKATSLLAELEMFAMIERLRLPAAPLGEGGAPEASVPVRVVDEMDFDALLARCRAAGKACFLPVFQDALLEALLFAEEGRVTRCACGHLGFPGFCKALLEDEKVAVYSADVKQLHRWCAQNGIRFSNAAMDTTLAGYLLNPNASGYAPGRLAREYGISLPAGGDDTVRAAAALPELCAVLEQELEKNQQTALMREIELPLARVLAAMELRGVPVLAARIEAFGDELSKRVNELLDEIYGCAGYIFNVNSPKQLGDVLFLKLGLRPPKKTKTGYSTNAEVLESLREEHPLIPLVLEYRTLSKLKSTYCEGLLKVIESDGRVRSSLNQTETRTGRISSSEPNLQNIPVRTALGRELRRCFAAPSGYVLVDADYSQIELRVMAAMAGEETMRKAFGEGQDIHAITAAQVFHMPQGMLTPLMRTRAKAVNFGILYGIGAFSLAKDIGVSFREADEYIEEYFAHYPAIRAFREEMIRTAKERGYAETLYGRRRALPELNHSQRQTREFGERVAVNMPIQGTAADIIKIAMIRVENRLARENLRARLILQVHDELIVEAPEEEARAVAILLKEEMEAAAALDVPLEVEAHIGSDWYSAKQ